MSGNPGLLGFPGLRQTSLLVAGKRTGFWAGDGADGTLVTSADVTLGSGDDDANVFEAHYSTLAINVGHTLTVAGRRRAFIIRVAGDCTIAGTISMTAKGAASATATADTRESNAKLTPVFEADLLYYAVPGQGGKGGLQQASSIIAHGKPGGAGVFGGAGGGGGGGGITGLGSAGGDGNAYGGGAGGGGGLGYDASGLGGSTVSGGGGAGSPPGAGGTSVGGLNTASTPAAGSAAGGRGRDAAVGGAQAAGATGVGGVIILVVGGTLTIASTGLIVANGLAGGAGGAGGGGSGGGSIIVLYGGSYSNLGTIQANGGVAGVGSQSFSGGGADQNGGPGGVGSIQGPTLVRIVR